jgi:hypothetical protein
LRGSRIENNLTDIKEQLEMMAQDNGESPDETVNESKSSVIVPKSAAAFNMMQKGLMNAEIK